MKVSRISLALLATMSFAAAATAAGIDMDNPHRALGREGDVRIDAQLARDTITGGAPVTITYQIHNLSDSAVAIADRMTDASYDEDNRTIIFGVGSEVPRDGNMPAMVLIAPGEKKVFTAAATPALGAAAMRSTMAIVPRFVQVKVAILRDVRPYLDLIEKRSRQRLSDELFEQWFESNDTIFLNTIPVRYQPPAASDIERRHGAR
ncbi:MAG TPA: hypothetical protein VNI54_18605 [Thermoanaerobaculia bacterium]|nr:hypothetical protein [Thermoanaerobaculia bacterium]